MLAKGPRRGSASGEDAGDRERGACIPLRGRTPPPAWPLLRPLRARDAQRTGWLGFSLTPHCFLTASPPMHTSVPAMISSSRLRLSSPVLGSTSRLRKVSTLRA